MTKEQEGSFSGVHTGRISALCRDSPIQEILQSWHESVHRLERVLDMQECSARSTWLSADGERDSETWSIRRAESQPGMVTSRLYTGKQHVRSIVAPGPEGLYQPEQSSSGSLHSTSSRDTGQAEDHLCTWQTWPGRTQLDDALTGPAARPPEPG